MKAVFVSVWSWSLVHSSNGVSYVNGHKRPARFLIHEHSTYGSPARPSLFVFLFSVLQLLHDLALVSAWIVSVGVVARLLLGSAFSGRTLCEENSSDMRRPGLRSRSTFNVVQRQVKD